MSIAEITPELNPRRYRRHVERQLRKNFQRIAYVALLALVLPPALGMLEVVSR